jgi:hypothetical protein
MSKKLTFGVYLYALICIAIAVALQFHSEPTVGRALWAILRTALLAFGVTVLWSEWRR